MFLINISYLNYNVLLNIFIAFTTILYDKYFIILIINIYYLCNLRSQKYLQNI